MTYILENVFLAQLLSIIYFKRIGKKQKYLNGYFLNLYGHLNKLTFFFFLYVSLFDLGMALILLFDIYTYIMDSPNYLMQYFVMADLY